LNELLRQCHDKRVNQAWWINSEKLIQVYLMARASDIAYFGQGVADQTFPHPTLQGVNSSEITDMITCMLNLLQEEEERRETEVKREALAEHETHVQYEFYNQFRNQLLPVPTHLPARTLSPDCVFHGILLPNLQESCHSIHAKVAMQSI
jgi:hypothetical protein